MNDSSGLVAAAISTRALPLRLALVLAAVAVFLGFFVFGAAVALTIGRDLVQPNAITLDVLLVAVVSAITWILFAVFAGLPSRSTHALVGGLTGAVIVSNGYQALMLGGLVKILLVLFAAPIVGAVVGYLVMRLVQRLTRHASPRVSRLFNAIQPLNVIVLAISYGANDGQKSVALLIMALVGAHVQSNFDVPLWVSLICATAITVGIATGGRRTMRTVGRRIYKLRPVHAFAAQTAASGIVLTAALLGGPVSTPQVVSTSIMGVGSAERVSAVHWPVAEQIVTAWLVTIPASAVVAVGLNFIFARLIAWTG